MTHPLLLTSSCTYTQGCRGRGCGKGEVCDPVNIHGLTRGQRSLKMVYDFTRLPYLHLQHQVIHWPPGDLRGRELLKVVVKHRRGEESACNSEGGRKGEGKGGEGGRGKEGRKEGKGKGREGGEGIGERGHPDVPIAMSWFSPPCPACSLVGRSLRSPSNPTQNAQSTSTTHSRAYTTDNPLPESGNPSDLIVVSPLDLASVHHVLDVGNSEGGLGYIGGHHAQTNPVRRGLKNLPAATAMDETRSSCYKTCKHYMRAHDRASDWQQQSSFIGRCSFRSV